MKKSKKLVLAMGSASALVAPVATVVACSPFGNKNSSNYSSYQFMNYEDYMAPSIIDEISQSYDFSTFGDLPELETAIVQQRVGAGIGSDYLNASMAGKGLIAKLRFDSLFGITSDESQWRTELKKLYTPAAWNLLTSFEITKTDSDGHPVDADGKILAAGEPLVHDVDGDGADDYLWEYMAPYFIQNKVIGVNLNRLGNKPKALDKATDGSFPSQVEFDKQVDLALNGKPRTYKNLLDIFKSWGGSNLAVNDYMRDNLMIGSENSDGSSFTGNVTESNFQSQVDGFKSLVSDWNKTWISSGVDNLDSIINQYKGDRNEVGLLYNGDALMAYNGGSEPDSADMQALRIAVPKNPTFLLDGFVVSKFVDEDATESPLIYSTAKQYLFRGIQTTYPNPNQDGNLTTHPGDAEKAYISGNKLYENFNYVNYTPAYNNLMNYVKDEFFKDDSGVDDETAKAISDSTNAVADQIDPNHITVPVTSELFNEVDSAYTGIKDKK